MNAVLNGKDPYTLVLLVLTELMIHLYFNDPLIFVFLLFLLNNLSNSMSISGSLYTLSKLDTTKFWRKFPILFHKK